MELGVLERQKNGIKRFFYRIIPAVRISYLSRLTSMGIEAKKRRSALNHDLLSWLEKMDAEILT